MNLFRLLLLVAAAWIVWRLYRSVMASRALRQSPPPEASFEPMARCTRCNAHVPAQSLSAEGLCGHCRD